jgi:A/G-specific adenine glycosylase
VTAPTLQELFLPWADKVRRDLPWRRTRDPWAIAVSEVMLQQTQVARVIPKWERFLDVFPTVRVCASAAQSEVVKLWDGLGYHRRAMNLHRAAIAVVDRFDGEFPSTIAELQTLPGFGPYTARAVFVFAFEGDGAVLDTNVGRIIARAVAGRPCSVREAQSIADSLVPDRNGWAWNQGMLDLGAMVCTKRDPKCDSCPISRMCTWFLAGKIGEDPAVGSAAVSTGQSRFVGSDRQGRGLLLKVLRNASVPLHDLAAVMGWPEDDARATRVADTLVVDGLVRLVGDRYELA